MALHTHSAPQGPAEDPRTIARNSRLGLGLFCIYLLLYSGFIGLNAFAPEKMESEAVAGVNLAVTYGFILIGAAVILSLVYGWLCRRDLPSVKSPPESASGQEGGAS